jgi:hypothetical protein
MLRPSQVPYSPSDAPLLFDAAYCRGYWAAFKRRLFSPFI